MATQVLIPALATGEISPSLFGRVDIDRERIAASTMRNMWVNYRGGCNSRAGTQFVGFSKQTGRSYPPRLLPFQFSLKQGLVLEFGHQYMRVIDERAFVTELPVAIGGATNANPCVLTFGAQGATSGTPNVGAVIATYAPGDLVTLAGGTALTPAVVEVATAQLVSIASNVRGDGYGVGDTVTLGGGTSSVSAVVTVASLAGTSASGTITFAANPADSDTITLNGVTWTFVTVPSGSDQTVIQASLALTMAQLAADLNASANASLTVATYYATPTRLDIVYDTFGPGGNAYTLAASAATPSGATLTGGSSTGVGTVSVTTPGNFTAVPGDGLMTQAATSGGGAGASFQAAVFGPLTITISNPGAYSAVPGNPVAQASTTGVGVGATFTMSWGAVAPFTNGDWIYVTGVSGMTELNGNTYVVAGATATTAQLRDVYGNAINSSAYGVYTGGGTASRIYTLPTPYSEQDLPWLKITESADVVTICCVNQDTGTEYAPRDLARNSNADWTLTAVIEAPTVSPPTNAAAAVNKGANTYYAYEVTAVSRDDATESIASNIARALGGSREFDSDVQVLVTWSGVPEVEEYKVYKAEISYYQPVPDGVLFGYIGSSYGAQFLDLGYTPDFSQVPPRHKDPFARGQVVAVNMNSGGSGYATGATSASISSGTGSGAVLSPVVSNGAIVSVIVLDAGSGYANGDTISFSGSGTGAAATLVIGPSSGTYPSVPGYFQQRRVFANSLNNPNTYWMSQPGGFQNFDVRIPTIDSDAITGSPWSVQVNGIQWLVQAPSGLLTMTGSSAWLLVGEGSFATNVQPISPSSQAVNPQPFTGASPTVPPLKILFDVVYVTAKGSYVYQLPYQGYAFTEPIDLTEYATHLFVGFQIEQWAWCEQPFKIIWATRDDGTMVSLSYLKAEQVYGWARHDTNGEFVSVCQISEPPVDALYLAAKRYPGSHTAYMIERMDDRIWPTVEDCWCVDSGLRLEPKSPNGTISADSATGAGTITGVTLVSGGTGYSSATVASIIDQALDEDNQPVGSGATASVTVAGGVITAVNITAAGSGYQRPRIDFIDPEAPAGGVSSPAAATLTLSNAATFTTDTSVFAMGDVGKVIRMGGGVATITAYASGTQVTANITTPIGAIRPNSGGIVQPQEPGAWTLGTPVSAVSGALHLAGATVTGLADGRVIPPTVVSASGSIALPFQASQVTIGLGFQAQVQSVPIDVGAPTVQGQRKKVAAISAYVEASRSVKIGQNQIDGSTLSPPQIAPEWHGMTAIPDSDLTAPPYGSLVPYYDSHTTPLGTGWVRTPVNGGWGKSGQIALQQDDPLPLNVVSLVPELLGGDQPEQAIGGGQQ